MCVSIACTYVFSSFFFLPLDYLFPFIQLYACKLKIELVRFECELINESVALWFNRIGMETIIVLMHVKYDGKTEIESDGERDKDGD